MDEPEPQEMRAVGLFQGEVCRIRIFHDPDDGTSLLDFVDLADQQPVLTLCDDHAAELHRMLGAALRHLADHKDKEA